MDIYAKLLGPPELWFGAEKIELSPNLRSTLVCYLAWSGDWVSRDAAAHLFWSDRTQSDALRNLRQLIHSLRKTELAGAVEVGSRRLRFRGTADLSKFRASLKQRDWDAAVEAWTGTFLEGFVPADRPEILAWIESESAALRQAYVTALTEQARERELGGDLEGAAERLGRVWRLDALDEEAISRQLALLHRSGNSAKAAAEARAYRLAFERELEMGPSGEIAELIERFESRNGSVPRSAATEREERRPPHLPAATTAFVGREAELEELLDLLQRGARLISVVGIGGIGKTRLILEAGHRLAARGGQVRWCSLVSVASADDVAMAVASACAVAAPRPDVLAAVADAIGSDPMVILIDNVEHVSGAVRSVAEQLLSACPRLAIVVSSRTELGMRSERSFPLEGLEHAGELDHNEAAQLFAACARRRDPTFRLEDHEEAVELLCREVGGMPLALELLASWAGVLTPPEMVAELQSGLYAVEFMAADVPERQRSLRVVLDAAWERLTPEAREALLVLSPCRGGFDLDTARALGASPRALHELVGVALLRRGRYRFGRHPLVWRYARFRAMADRASWEEIRARHARYFLARLEAQKASLATQESPTQAERLWRDDLENLRRAIRWSAEHEGGDRFLETYFLYLKLEACFGPPVDVSFNLELQQRVGPRIRAHLGLTLVEERDARSEAGGSHDRVESVSDALAVARSHGDALLEARALARLGESARVAGDTTAALGYAEQAIAAFRGVGGADGWLLATLAARAHVTWGLAEIDAGSYREARRAFERSVAVLESVGATAFEEVVLLAYADLEFGDYERASTLAQKAFAATRRDSPASTRLKVSEARGVVRLVRGDLPSAQADLTLALDVARRVFAADEDRVERRLRSHLGYLFLLRGDLEAAAPHLAAAGATPEDDLRRARLHWHSGELEEAAALLASAVDSGEAPAAPPWPGLGIQARSLLAHVHLEAGRLDDAADCAAAALARASELALPRHILFASVPAARILLVAGDDRRGRQALTAISEDGYADYETLTLAKGYGASVARDRRVWRSTRVLREWATWLTGALVA